MDNESEGEHPTGADVLVNGEEARGSREMVEAVARDSYGRLVSYLTARCGDLTLAEDALGDAFLSALRTWPERGIPARPVAWILSAASNRIVDAARHQRVRAEHAELMARAARSAQEVAESEEFPDERLRLLLLCADPAIDAAVHTPLMLQVVLGLDGARIAQAFLVSPAAMRQRLVRAKARMRDAGLRVELPPPNAFPRRLAAVTEAIYGAYARGWEEMAGSDPGGGLLAREAVWLARILVRVMPEEPEARGLLALLLHGEARQAARRSAHGEYVPIAEQDTRRWSRALIEEADRELSMAWTARRPGRFQLEAAIQSAHAERAHSGRVDRQAIALLYEGLVRVAPTLGSLVGRAAAVAEAEGPEAGLALLDQIGDPRLDRLQAHWALRAHLLARAGRASEARAANERAIALTEDGAVRRFLEARQRTLASS